MPCISDDLALAVQHHQAGRLQAAEQIYRQLLARDPNQHDALHLLGVIAHQQGRVAEAIPCYERALRIKPDFADAHHYLGRAFEDQGRLPEAITCYERALELRPDYVGARRSLAEAHFLFGLALAEQGKLNDAVFHMQRTLKLEPNSAEAHNNLGAILHDLGRMEEAVRSCRRALELQPAYANAHNNLGNALKDQGLLHEAIASYRQGLQVKPDHAGLHSNLVFTLNFCPDYDAQTIFDEHRRWNQQHAEPLAHFIEPHANDRAPDRRLRIGYVSPDFSLRSVGRFLLPLLQANNHDIVEVFCYSSVRLPDKITDRCRACADVWRHVLGVSDEQLARTIRQDRIDILVDLTMHAAENRLLVFARKPAPVQVTYLAYCSTTGLDAMDYRLTDPYLDPPGQVERFYAEQSIHLPETYWCYRPPIKTPRVNKLPAPETRHITFGCMNNFCKVTEPTLTAWSRLLQALPGSRLVLHAHAGSQRDRVRDFFTKHHVAPERLTCLDMVPITDYFKIYDRIDVALDPFPYGGGTTTCDALWMGVPVVTLAGLTAVGRGGLSILSNMGLAELVAHDTDDYVRLAVDLASDLPRLTALRGTLRERMQASPLMDAPNFARAVEAAYREMWHRWCKTKNDE